MTNIRRCLETLLASTLWLLAVERGVGENPDIYERQRIYRPDDVRPKIATPEEALSRRLNSGREMNETERLVQQILQNLSENDKQNIIRSIQKNPDLTRSLAQDILTNPKLRKQLENSVQQKEITPEDRNWLKEASKRFEQSATPTTEEGTRPAPMNPAQPMTDPMAKAPPVPQPSSPATGSEAAKPDAPKEEQSGWKTRLLNALPKAADLLADMGLTDDADFLRSLFKGKLLTDHQGFLAESVRRGIAVARELPLEKLFAGNLSGVFDFSLPSVPKINLSFGDGESGGGGRSAVSSDEGGMTLVWLLLLLLLLVVLWKGKRVFRLSTEKPAEAWKLGPWPVPPLQVRTRADLIKAFEYLVYLLLGPTARPRNHVDLATDLAGLGDDSTWKNATDRLAHLYERARYAPLQEELPSEEMRSAGRDLTFLAGVGRA